MDNIISKVLASTEYVDEKIKDLNDHTENVDVHVTAEEKEKWNNNESKMTVTPVSNNAEYPLLLAAAGQTAELSTSVSYFDSGITVNPETNTINANSTSCCGYKLQRVSKMPTSPDPNTLYIIIE